MSNNILRSRSETTDERRTGPDAGGSSVDRTLLEAGSAVDAAHRSRLYGLVALALDRPGDDHREAMADGAFIEELRESASIYDDKRIEQAIDRVADAYTDLDKHRREWASLFGVEEGVTVSPYQLTYLPGPLVTTVRELADMKGFYQAFGLEIAPEERDRGDNIVFQVEFLSHLLFREATLRQENDTEGVSVVVGAQRSFLEDHLGRWYWRFAEEVAKQDTGGFYVAVAELLAALVEEDIDRLGADPEWVPDDPEVTEWNEGVFGDSGRNCGGCGAVDDDGEAPTDAGLMDTYGPPDEDRLPDIDEYGPLNDE